MENGNHGGKAAAAVGVLCLLMGAAFSAGRGRAPERSSPCQDSDAARAAARLACVTKEQLELVLSYRHSPWDEPSMRRALAAAYQIARCINNSSLFGEGSERKDYHCLQHRLLEFYQQFDRRENQPRQLHSRDLLARASLRIHYCMIDEDSPISYCLSLIEQALQDYQTVFRSAAHNTEETIPDFSDLKAFVDLSLENALKFPMIVGKQIGAALGPVLCGAYRLYPEQHAYINHHYNLLIRFDGGNMAASGQLYQFIQDLEKVFRPEPASSSFVQPRPIDWKSLSPACGSEDWAFVSPEFILRPGYRPPSRPDFVQALHRLEGLLGKCAEFAEQGIHLWQPFYRYGDLLVRLSQSLKKTASRDEELWQTRHMLMEKARDAFLLRAVPAAKRPLDPKTLQTSIGEHIRAYGGELLSEVRLDALIGFAEEYLKAGETILGHLQKKDLHRQLAIAYFVRGDHNNAQTHREKSGLPQPELEKARQAFRKLGIRR